MRSIFTKRNVVDACAIFGILLLVVVSTILRAPKPMAEDWVDSDATYHVLLTMEAYAETPASVHHYLPLVSLGGVANKNIPWGATIPDSFGNYYYTSFTSAGFVAPYAFVKLLDLPINENSLYLFNSLIMLLSGIMCCLLFMKLFSRYFSKTLIALMASLIYFFQMEIMHSQGIVYWAQSLFQLFFLIQVVAFLYMGNKYFRYIFFAFCLINPYVEWTGYIGNIGFAIAMFLNGHLGVARRKILITRRALGSAGLIVLLTLSSFALSSYQFLQVLSRDQYVGALKYRFLARSVTAPGNFVDLAIGYFTSYASFIILLAFLVVLVVLNRGALTNAIGILKVNFGLVFIFAFILLENILMVRHAVLYSFDRMKGIFILMLIFFVLIASLAEKCRRNHVLVGSLVSVLVVSAALNLYFYSSGRSDYRWHDPYYEDNRILAQYLDGNQNADVIVGYPHAVRGYINLLFHRGIYEHASISKLTSIANREDRLEIVQLKGNTKAWNRDQFTGFYEYDLSTGRLRDTDIAQRDIIQHTYIAVFASDWTDSNWIDGISRDGSIVLLANSETNRNALQGYAALRSGNTTKTVSRIEYGSQWIRLYLNDGIATAVFSAGNPIEVVK